MVVKLALKRKNENIQIWSRYSLFKNTDCSLPASSSAALRRYLTQTTEIQSHNTRRHPRSSRWHNEVFSSWYYLIRTTYGQCSISSWPGHFRCYSVSSGWYNGIWDPCHPDNLAPGGVSSGWPMTDAVCHADDLQCNLVDPGGIMKWKWNETLCHPDYLAPGGISSGWLLAHAVCLPNDILC